MTIEKHHFITSGPKLVFTMWVNSNNEAALAVLLSAQVGPFKSARWDSTSQLETMPSLDGEISCGGRGTHHGERRSSAEVLGESSRQQTHPHYQPWRGPVSPLGPSFRGLTRIGYPHVSEICLFLDPLQLTNDAKSSLEVFTKCIL